MSNDPHCQSYFGAWKAVQRLQNKNKLLSFKEYHLTVVCIAIYIYIRYISLVITAKVGITPRHLKALPSELRALKGAAVEKLGPQTDVDNWKLGEVFYGL